MNTRTAKLGLLAASTILLGATACNIERVPTGELRKESQSVKLGDAKSVRMEVKMGSGELKVAGGASQLLDAEFTYNVPAWKPLVDYNASGTQGYLTIRQPAGVHGTEAGVRYNWDLHLNNSVPLDMTVEMGAGRADLTLGTLSLNSLDLKFGAGESVVDLTGDWKNDLTARIRGGVGKVTLRLPRDVGVRVDAEGGIGSINAADFKKQGHTYVNEAYGKSHVTLRVDVKAGVGEINLELGGAPPVV
jgi:hypothetical protein